MKKLILLAFIAISTQVYPQGAAVAVMRTTSGVDSVRSNGTTPVYLNVSPQNSYSCAIFQVGVTRVSTAIGGTVTMQGSVDGTNWYNASNTTGDTLTIANSASQYQRLKVAPIYGLPYNKYRLAIVGVTNDTMTVRAWFSGR